MPNPVQLADDSGQPINILNPLPTSVTPGTGPTSLGKAADAPHAPGDVGVLVLGVRQDAFGAPLAQSDDDYAPVMTDEFGFLATGPDGRTLSASATSASTLFVADMLGYQSIAVQVTSPGTSCTITYETSNDAATWLALPAFDVAFNGGSGTTPASTSTTASMRRFGRAGRYFRCRVSTYGSGTVAVIGVMSQAPANHHVVGMVSNSGSGIGVIGLQNEGGGSGSGTFGNAMEARTTAPTAVTNGQWKRPIVTTQGVQITKPYQIPNLDWTYAAAAGGIVSGAQSQDLVAAGAAGIRNYLTGLSVAWTALGAASEIVVRSKTTTATVLWRGTLGTAAGSLAVAFPTPPAGIAAEVLEVTLPTTLVSGAVYFNAQGYQAP